jgi:hypothetical protein
LWLRKFAASSNSKPETRNLKLETHSPTRLVEELTETPQCHAVQLEQKLASALMSGKEWQLSPSEVEHLRITSLTDQCRSIADKKMSLGC